MPTAPRFDRTLTDDEREHVEQNIGLAYAMVNRYRQRFPMLREDDILSACMLGLVEAVRTYDPALSMWGTHASHWMWMEVKTASEGLSLVRLPANTYRIRGDIEEGDKEHVRAVKNARNASWLQVEPECHAAPSRREERKRLETVEAVRQAVDRLPEPCRSVVTLVHLEGQTLRAAGKSLGYSREWVARLVDKGLRMLGRTLADCQHE